MEIKEYNVKYLNSIININNSCHKKPQPSLGLLEQINKGQTWVAVEKDKVIGFLVSIDREGPYVYNIAVLPEYRNKGIATALFNKFHNFNKEQNYVYLYVDALNPAQKLYFDLGYRVTNIKENFYGYGQHALVMLKVFDNQNNM